MAPGGARELARAWSAGYLAAKGSLGISNGVVVLEIRSRDAWEDVHRFIAPLDDLRHSLRLVERRGHPVTLFFIRGDALRQAMERLRPYLPVRRIKEYEDLVARLRGAGDNERTR